jgi:glycerophosphoryl diester phosphodiesterase
MPHSFLCGLVSVPSWEEYVEWHKLAAANSGTHPLMHFIAVLSVTLLAVRVAGLFPHLLHKRQSLPAVLKGGVIAHRGSREEGLPENTVAAFKDAIKAGAEIVELDVWLTKDGKVVVHHDESVARMTDGERSEKIFSFDFAELPKIVPTGLQKARISSYEQKEWQQIPLLEDVLKVVPLSVGMVIEFKQDSKELIDKVHDLVVAGERNKAMYWFSLDEGINAKLRAKDSNIPTINSVAGMLKTVILHRLGILPFLALPDAVFGITMEEITLEKVRKERVLKALPDWAKRLVAYALAGKPSGFLLNPALFSHLRKRGMPVWFLGCADQADLQLAVKSGATAVLTDRPTWLCKLKTQYGIRFFSLS